MSMEMIMISKNNILRPKSTHFIGKTFLLHVPSRAVSINFMSSLEPYKSPWRGFRSFSKPISVVASGLDDSLPVAKVKATPKGKATTVKNAKIYVELQDNDKIQVRVELKGETTQKLFNKALTELRRSSNPIVRGFRKQKGGQPSKVPQNVLELILGKDRVTNFLIKEIVNSTLLDYVEKEKLALKEKKVNTIQSAEELKSSFKPGSDFQFNAILDIVKSQE